jgi:hypothetical protein
MVFIFSYNRKEMLENVFQHTGHLSPIIIDDGSDFKIEYRLFVQYQHGGKEHFWEKWDDALKLAEHSSDEFYLFIPDDFLDIDIAAIMMLHERLKNNPYACNVINDKRTKCWNSFVQQQIDEILYSVGFVDCGFFCNRSALDAIGFHIEPIDKSRFQSKTISSGVGLQLTQRFTSKNVAMYKPIKSLAFHGNHESLMFPHAKNLKKLISL